MEAKDGQRRRALARRALHRALKIARRALIAMVASWLALVLLALAVPLPERLAQRPSPIVLYRDGTPAHAFLSADDKWRLPARWDQVDPAYLRALIAFEDRRFLRHLGVDALSLLRAAGQNLSRGRVVSGGSTIPMQLARLLEPRPRTLLSKIIEAFRALQFSLRLSKAEILDAYLCFVPYGGNLEGVETAARAFFGHGAKALSAEEIAFLLSVPQDPSRLAPGAGERLRSARDTVARRLQAAGVMSGEAAAQAMAAPVAAAARPLPREAPHAARWMLARIPGTDRLRSTLDREAQRTAETLFARARPELARRGIYNGAAVVLDRQGAVRALVGNFDFFDEKNSGQYAAFAVPRSVGSALKPFLYALAIDRGMVLPGFLVPDIPVEFGSYAPKNFDDSFSGLVRLDEALSQSLNVPFVNLLRRFGVEEFLGALSHMGAPRLAGQLGRHGLSAAIGAIELSPLEMAAMYTTLNRDGAYLEPVFVEPIPAPVPLRALSPGASYLTRQALRRRDRPDFPQRARLTGLSLRVHWKTGTSFGHRDAWAAGSLGDVTAVVWLGNLDNRGSRSLLGAETAAPLLFDLLEALAGHSPGPAADPPPNDLAEIEVCAFSGHPPGPDCPERRTALALRSNVPTEACPYHIVRDVDLATGLALSPACRAGREVERRTFVALPAGVRRYLRNEVRWAAPPPFAPGCVAASESLPPRITSPMPGQTLVLLPGLPPDRQEFPLAAEAPGGSGRLSWFVDGRYLGTFDPGERVWWTPRPGRHDIVVTAEDGLSDRCVLTVRAAE